jgi:cephalosporin hydroxylase
VCGVGFGILFTVSRFWRSASTGSKKSAASLISFRSMMKASVLLAAFFLGVFYGNYRHASSLYSAAGWRINEKYDDYDYNVTVPGYKNPFDIHVCHSYLVSWDPGMTIEDGQYQDTGGCKDFGVHGTWFRIVRIGNKFADFRRGPP